MLPVEIAPSKVSELAARVQQADRDGLTIGIGGPSASPADLVVSLRHLELSIDHCAGDLVATVPAGTSLRDANQVLERGGQWLPLDPPDPDRSIGAIIATNDSGPRRHRHGTPRDLILGAEMVLADGRIAKAGGRVVKNVAGYDLSRLLCGSHGSLAIITSATFKLAPLPSASRTVIISVRDAPVVGELAAAIAGAPLTPSALELAAPTHRLLVRFETTAAAADRQAAAASAICAHYDAPCSVVSGGEEDAAWNNFAAGVWRASGTLLAIHVLPIDVAVMLEAVAQSAAEYDIDWRAGGRAAMGVIHVKLTDRAERHGAVAEHLRSKARARGGSLVVLATHPAVDSGLDRWGDLGDALPLMRAVKTRFDPNGTLNPGRAPGGL